MGVTVSGANDDHDQRLKSLLKEFFPDWAGRFDFTRAEWQDKEVFVSPPRGERRVLDLVAKVPLLPGVPPPPRGGVEQLLAVIHVEAEARRSVAAFRPRMFEYFAFLTRQYGPPVVPVAVSLNVGMKGVG